MIRRILSLSAIGFTAWAFALGALWLLGFELWPLRPSWRTYAAAFCLLVMTRMKGVELLFEAGITPNRIEAIDREVQRLVAGVCVGCGGAGMVRRLDDTLAPCDWPGCSAGAAKRREAVHAVGWSHVFSDAELRAGCIACRGSRPCALCERNGLAGAGPAAGPDGGIVNISDRRRP